MVVQGWSKDRALAVAAQTFAMAKAPYLPAWENGRA